LLRNICVFCGSSAGTDPRYLAAAQSFGRALAVAHIRVIYGGASVGLMGALANAALDAGGDVIGVIPAALFDREIAHRGLTDLRVVASMHERKAMMAELADAFVALPGGLGTLEELFEVWTWGMLGLHQKPYGLQRRRILRSPHRVPRPGYGARLHAPGATRAPGDGRERRHADPPAPALGHELRGVHTLRGHSIADASNRPSPSKEKT